MPKNSSTNGFHHIKAPFIAVLIPKHTVHVHISAQLIGHFNLFLLLGNKNRNVE